MDGYSTDIHVIDVHFLPGASVVVRCRGTFKAQLRQIGEKYLSNLSNAIKKSFGDWVTKIDEDFAKAEIIGLIPHKSPEQIKAEAKAIWKKAHE